MMDLTEDDKYILRRLHEYGKLNSEYSMGLVSYLCQKGPQIIESSFRKFLRAGLMCRRGSKGKVKWSRYSLTRLGKTVAEKELAMEALSNLK
jgi:hypothetical protein